MPQIGWTRGFCRECGRFVGHFRTKQCPQCRRPLAAGAGVRCLDRSGLEYAAAITLGLITTGRWTPSRVFERVLFSLLGIKPRNAEEIYITVGLLVEFSLLAIVSGFQIGLASPAGVVIALLVAWRLSEMICTRLRIVLFDRAVPDWRHGTFSRSAIMLFVNLSELILLFAIAYQLLVATDCGSTSGLLQAIAYSWGRFFSIEIAYPAFHCGCARTNLQVTAVLQLSCEFVLVVFALSSLISMLSEGRQATRS